MQNSLNWKSCSIWDKLRRCSARSFDGGFVSLLVGFLVRRMWRFLHLVLGLFGGHVMSEYFRIYERVPWRFWSPLEYFRFLNVDARCREECGFVVRDSQGVVSACLARKLVGSFPLNFQRLKLMPS